MAMTSVLIGADFEENLGVGMVVAAAVRAGHTARVLPFAESSQIGDLVRDVLAADPDVVGLSMQFQHRGHEFLSVARRLRASGFAGHITCGGQYASLTYREIVANPNGIDSVILHDGEGGFAELLDTLEDPSGDFRDVAGLAFLGDDGVPVRTQGRRLVTNLDHLPFPMRYRPHSRHMGVPFIPIMGSRGCWGDCSFCSITSFYRDARSYGGGKTVRFRSPENIAEEMSLLWHAAGGEAIFCFHDDNFLLPRPAATLERVRAIRSALDEYGAGERIGLVGKCRPDCLTPELAHDLRDLGVIRLYVGVENVSRAGAEHLSRTAQTEHVARALRACREAGIFACYNLLIFEPEATIQDVADNVAFIREFADHPVNFCRAEPYTDTPMHRDLAARGRLGGSYLGFDYRIADDDAELLFRICASAFRDRNFACDGVHNRLMGVGYHMKILERFHADPDGAAPALSDRSRTLTRSVTRETARFLSDAIAIVHQHGTRDGDRIARETALLGLRIAAADQVRHAELDRLTADMLALSRRRGEAPRKPLSLPASLSVRTRSAVRELVLGGWLIAASTSAACSNNDVIDPAPKDAGIDSGVADPVPYDGGLSDPVPYDGGLSDPLPADNGVETPVGMPATRGDLPLIDQWREITPRRAVRSQDLPLHDPPGVVLRAVREAAGVRVEIDTDSVPVSTRWQCDGEVIGAGPSVVWRPAGDSDLLRVAVRSQGGVSVVAIRASEVSGG